MADETDAEIVADLAALARGQLDPESAYLVADYLAERPDRAQAVLSDARTIEGLRLALAPATEAPPAALTTAARRLEDRLKRRRLVRRTAPWALAVAMLAVGWTGHVAWQAYGAGGSSPLVEAALDAQSALELRHWMTSQPESLDLDPREIVAALGITLPRLPDEWTVRDVQVVPSPTRPGVAIAIEAPELGPVLLFAIARASGSADEPPVAFDYEGRTFAVFERGPSAYVLIDDQGYPEQLSAGANLLLSRFN